MPLAQVPANFGVFIRPIFTRPEFLLVGIHPDGQAAASAGSKPSKVCNFFTVFETVED